MTVQNVIFLVVFLIFPQIIGVQAKTTYLLPDGKEYVSWEVPFTYSKTWYVDNGNPNASDNNDGSQERPFLTISKAAEVLQPGERVIINSGVYREQVRHRRGGTGRAVMRSCSHAVMQSCSHTVLRSCSHAVMQFGKNFRGLGYLLALWSGVSGTQMKQSSRL